jgi:cob(I)alamin adenosyltransferase
MTIGYNRIRIQAVTEGKRMVYLSRIYTKAGDQGQTSLGDGTRVRKDSARVAAYGDVDELNSLLGVLRCTSSDLPEAELLQQVQNDLFDLGADLCLPQPPDEPAGQRLRVRPEQPARLEHAIDRFNEKLTPLESFVLPGGRPAAAWCHLARTVCRRAERDVVALASQEPINPQIVIYLNRLSDLLFVLARAFNDNGRKDILWIPGGATPTATTKDKGKERRKRKK